MDTPRVVSRDEWLAERMELLAAGWEIAYDGMEVRL